MFRFYSRLTGRQPVKSKQDRRRIESRRLRAESLETRMLLAEIFLHNPLNAEDVNADGIVSAMDALNIINAMARRSQSDGRMFTDVNNDGQRTASDALRIINRIGRDRAAESDRELDPLSKLNRDDPNSVDTSFPYEVRTLDGTGNNVDHPTLGSANQPLLRVGNVAYADGISAPAGQNRPSARTISNSLAAADPRGTTNDRHLSAFIFVWGQFLDHDLDLTPSPKDDEPGQESFNITVPGGDPSFDPNGTGQATIALNRSIFDPGTGTSSDNPRQQINTITSFIDGSQVYGIDQQTADSLREFSGGRMLISDQGLLPLDGEDGFLAGDVRAAENIVLASMHTLFVREHNRLADDILTANPQWSDEDVYQQARAIVIAQIQAITYKEFLPALLGQGVMEEYDGYDRTVNPTIANEFSTAAFRFGHSTLNDDIQFFGNHGRAVAEKISLAEAFFQPALLSQTGIDVILKFEASTLSQQIDLQVVDSVRNFLFGHPGQGGLDLVALNIQRGRDHGLSDYNSTRQAYGLIPYESFDQITSDVGLQQKLQSLYGDVNHIDLWVGLLAEDHTAGASVGELTSTIITDQFQRLRDGDRLWYENVFSEYEVGQLNETTLHDIIERNTTVSGLQDDVFHFRAEVSGAVHAVLPDVGNSNAVNPDPQHPDNEDAALIGVQGVAMELRNTVGEIVATSVTDHQGVYRFTSFNETGLYQIRIAENQPLEIVGSNRLDVLIFSGDLRLTGMGFQVQLDFLGRERLHESTS